MVSAIGSPIDEQALPAITCISNRLSIHELIDIAVSYEHVGGHTHCESFTLRSCRSDHQRYSFPLKILNLVVKKAVRVAHPDMPLLGEYIACPYLPLALTGPAIQGWTP